MPGQRCRLSTNNASKVPPRNAIAPQVGEANASPSPPVTEAVAASVSLATAARRAEISAGKRRASDACVDALGADSAAKRRRVASLDMASRVQASLKATLALVEEWTRSCESLAKVRYHVLLLQPRVSKHTTHVLHVSHVEVQRLIELQGSHKHASHLRDARRVPLI